MKVRAEPLNIVSFWGSRTPKPPAYWEEWHIMFHGYDRQDKYDSDPDDFYFAATLNATAIAALLADVNGKNRVESAKKLNSILYLCIGHEAQLIFEALKPGVNFMIESITRT